VVVVLAVAVLLNVVTALGAWRYYRQDHDGFELRYWPEDLELPIPSVGIGPTTLRPVA
jgi:hypothetical protein